MSSSIRGYRDSKLFKACSGQLDLQEESFAYILTSEGPVQTEMCSKRRLTFASVNFPCAKLASALAALLLMLYSFIFSCFCFPAVPLRWSLLPPSVDCSVEALLSICFQQCYGCIKYCIYFYIALTSDGRTHNTI